MADKQEHYQISEKSQQEFFDHSHVLQLEERGIVQCGIATCREMFSVFRKNQQKHMLLFTVRGKGWLECNDCRYVMEPSSLIVVPAGLDNGFGIEEETWQIAWLFLNPDFDWSHIVHEDIQYSYTPASEVMYSCIQTILRSDNLPIETGGAVWFNCISIIENLIKLPTSAGKDKQQIKLNRVFDIVQRQLHKEWTVRELSKLFPCSEPHLHRLCQHYFGRSPIAQLTRMRMEYAARLLRSTEWPIQHIGEVVGYPIAANFSTRFRAWSGMTPRSFRNADSMPIPHSKASLPITPSDAS